MIISFIISKQQGVGNLSSLFNAIESRGWKVAVPTPFAHMTQILKHKGFEAHYIEPSEMGNVEVWEKP